jgi:hypothetical protein
MKWQYTPVFAGRCPDRLDKKGLCAAISVCAVVDHKTHSQKLNQTDDILRFKFGRATIQRMALHYDNREDVKSLKPEWNLRQALQTKRIKNRKEK